MLRITQERTIEMLVIITTTTMHESPKATVTHNPPLQGIQSQISNNNSSVETASAITMATTTTAIEDKMAETATVTMEIK